LVLFVAALPFMAVTAALVLFSLGWPLFFVQQRSGLEQATFRMVKFRTMRPPDPRDSRIASDEDRTPEMGRLLRRTRLDELPGLLNVVRGELALIGPRPLLPETVRKFGPSGWRRAAVRPGMTGWAQINGNTLLSEEEKLALDLWYIENRSWRLDLLILARTFSVALLGERVNRHRIIDAGSVRGIEAAGPDSSVK